MKTYKIKLLKWYCAITRIIDIKDFCYPSYLLNEIDTDVEQ